MELVPLSSPFGVEVRGLDLGARLGDAEVGELRDALDQHKLLLIRGQEVQSADHLRFAELFGFSVAEVDGEARREVSNTRSGGSEPLAFHTDHLYTEGGSSPALTLYALEIPPGGTSTHFADMALAFETLSEEVRDQLGPLQAWHGFSRGDYQSVRHYPNPDPRGGFRSLHPVIGTHPRTGARLLWVSDVHTERIEGLTAADSLDLIDFLCAHLARPEHRYEHQWRVHDLIVWDNIALQHARGAADLSDGPRRLRRFVLDTRGLLELTPKHVLLRKA
jgi:taurine dioxygenase